jgi:hypothetical protein
MRRVAGVRARAGAAVGAALVLLGACTGGDGAGRRPAVTTTSSTTSAVPPVTSTAPATTTTAAPVVDPAGSVTLRMTAFTLPDLRSGGTGLRVVVRAASPRLTVRRRGGGGAVSACPVPGATAAVVAAECVDLGAAGTIELPATGGVELRATAAEASVDEVSVTYVAATRATTVVTPARPAGACAVRPCEATFALVPARPGSFVLDGRAGGGRPRLVLTAVPAAGGAGSNRTLATVEGGASLSIRASLSAGEEASLLHHDEGSGAIAPVTAEILWP